MKMKSAITYFIVFFSLLLPVQHIGAQPGVVKTYGYISAGKLKIYYCDEGKGPAVVLLHAGFLDMRMWEEQADSLAKNHRVLRMDLPGHGQSTGNDTSIRIAEVINRLMTVLRIPVASFVGISLGASCVVDFALAHPEKVKKLVLCSPGLIGWEEVMTKDTLSKRVFVRDDTYFNTKDPDLVTEKFVHYWLDGPYRTTAPVDASVRQYVFNTAVEKAKRSFAGGPVFDKRKAVRRVQSIRKPVLILYGALDIPFVKQVSNFFIKKIKGVQVKAIEGTAHLFVLEQPGVVEGYLREWLK